MSEEIKERKKPGPQKGWLEKKIKEQGGESASRIAVSTSNYDETLFREAMLALMTSGTNSESYVKSCIPAAELYVKIVKEKFEK